MQYSTRTIIEMIADGRCLPPDEGDIYIVNDPYLGGTHLMDVRFAMPVWRAGKIFCWLSNTGHWPDIGGARARRLLGLGDGGRAGGLRLPPVKLFKTRQARSRDLRDHHLQHPRRRPAHRRYPRRRPRRCRSARSGSSPSSTAMATTRSSRRSPSSANAPPSRCAPTSPPFPMASTAPRLSSIPTASSTSR